MLTARLPPQRPESLYRELSSIFKRNKDRFQFLSDRLRWGEIEYWEGQTDIPHHGKLYGDCDTFTLANRKDCRLKMIPSRIVECRVRNSNGALEKHVVLECEGWVLCNRQDKVMAKQALEQDHDYQWVKISGYTKGEPWHEVKA